MKHPLFVAGNGKNYFVPFVLVTSLFFLWGFAHSILDVLNKHFQNELAVSKAESGLIQTMVYGGYFLMAIPAGWVIQKWGYQKGVVLGLLLYGIGALMFIPGEWMMSFHFFLISLFVIGCGLTFLETSANPYVAILGKPEDGARRLNLAQSFNGFGWIMGPMVGSLLILGDSSCLALPYAVIGVVVILLSCVFNKLSLPVPVSEEIMDDKSVALNEHTHKPVNSLLHNKRFCFGVLALFLYVAAQTGINSFFINYVTENYPLINARTAGFVLSFGGMGLFLIGRLLGSSMMKSINPQRLLAFCAFLASVCVLLIILNINITSLIALCAVYLFESIMFPTIFALALLQSDNNTEKASSVLIMSIVGGAIAPVLMGYIGRDNMSVGFIIPLFCFVSIFLYAITYSKE